MYCNWLCDLSDETKTWYVWPDRECIHILDHDCTHTSKLVFVCVSWQPHPHFTTHAHLPTYLPTLFPTSISHTNTHTHTVHSPDSPLTSIPLTSQRENSPLTLLFVTAVHFLRGMRQIKSWVGKASYDYTSLGRISKKFHISSIAVSGLQSR